MTESNIACNRHKNFNVSLSDANDIHSWAHFYASEIAFASHSIRYGLVWTALLPCPFDEAVTNQLHVYIWLIN